MSNEGISKEEWAELRVAVAQEPVGSPAHRLLAEFDRLEEHKKVRDRAASIDTLRYGEGFTEEQAVRLYDYLLAGGKLEHETVQCFVCKGARHVWDMGCMGGRMEDCQKCHGRGERISFKLPAESTI